MEIPSMISISLRRLCLFPFDTVAACLHVQCYMIHKGRDRSKKKKVQWQPSCLFSVHSYFLNWILLGVRTAPDWLWKWTSNPGLCWEVFRERSNKGKSRSKFKQQPRWQQTKNDTLVTPSIICECRIFFCHWRYVWGFLWVSSCYYCSTWLII
jgi:hypothetical protein